MLQSLFNSRSTATLEAFGRSFAIIEFRPDGTIVKANQNFLSALGYEDAELVGKHHRLFVGEEDANGQKYTQFWSDLASGKPHAGEFRRFGKGRKSVWIQASYCPVLDKKGKVVSVVKLAADITATKVKAAENQSVLDAVSKSQGIISFTPTGDILDANENFLTTMGYRRDEIVGRHHRMFVSKAESDSPAYRDFWKRLAGGEFISQEFRRVGKGGKEILIQAAYNPVFDADGRVTMVKKLVFDLKERMESIERLGKGLNRLSMGDLTFKIDAPLVETMESLRRDYNDTVDKLRSSLSQIVEGSSAIQSNSREISQSTDDLSRRTEQQAASLEQTAAAIEQITATGKKAAEGAQHARDVVTTAKNDAAKTGDVVRQAVEAMGSIEKSAQQITQIISVIDEIAFQTNLLALNAGVEAARAGEAGRGFAVVASEVRALAQRSAEAAKEIKGLISTSSAQVADGVSLVAETGKALERILEQVGEINTVVIDIASGAHEQATGLQQVNSAINQMDQTTQQNAAMVQETTAASRSLADESSNLDRLIGQFRVSDTERRASAVPPVLAAASTSRPTKSSSSRPVAKPIAPKKSLAMRRSSATAAVAATGSWEEF